MSATCPECRGECVSTEWRWCAPSRAVLQQQRAEEPAGAGGHPRGPAAAGRGGAAAAAARPAAAPLTPPVDTPPASPANTRPPNTASNHLQGTSGTSRLVLAERESH